MPSPYDYSVAQPNVSTYFDAMREGRADRLTEEKDQRMNALSKYLPGALQGDSEQRESALAASAGDPNMMLQLSQTFAGADQQKLAKAREVNGQIASLAAWADTPDKWAIALSEARKLSPDIGDIPFEQRGAIIAKAQTVAEQLEQAWKAKAHELDVSRTTAQNAASYASAAAARASAEAARRKPVGNVDPNTGVRIAPQGTQNKDVAQLQKYEQTADAFAGIATTLRGAQGAFDRVKTGPGTGIARMAASPFALFGVESANQFVGDYDAIDAAAKESGIEKLKSIGGSDTERELLTAIQTGVNAETPGPENKRRIGNAIAAAEIASQRHRLATEWFNKFGSLAYTAPNGMTWPQFWSSYQKQAWADHLRTTQGPAGGNRDYRGEQRQLMQGQGSPSVPPPPPGFEVR